MIANNLNKALDLILAWEGPEVNQSNTEPGGISKYGISLVAYGDYSHSNGLPLPVTPEIITALTEADARKFYGSYWLPQMRFNDLPNGIDVRLADIAVNLGIRGAINLLELVLLEFPLLGKLSDQDIVTITNYTPAVIIIALSAAWIAKKHESPNWYPTPENNHKGFGEGWTNRNKSVTMACLSLLTANK